MATLLPPPASLSHSFLFSRRPLRRAPPPARLAIAPRTRCPPGFDQPRTMKRQRPGGEETRIMSVPGEPRLFGAEPSAMLDIIEISKDEEPGRDWCRPVKAEGRAKLIPVEDSAVTITVVEHGRDWCRPVKAEGRAKLIPVEDSAGTITVLDYGETITVEDYAEAVVVEEYWEAVRAKRATAVSVASSLQQIIDVDFVEDADVEIIEDRKGKGIQTYSRKRGRRSVMEQGESSGGRALEDHPSPPMGTPPSPLPLLPTAVCGICLEDKLHSECSAMKDCDHLFCSDCIVKYVEAKVQENVTAVKCPQPGCKDGSLDPLMCCAILPDQVFERWCTALCEALFAGEARFYCPFKDCSALLIDEPACSDAGEKVDVITHSECPHCHRLFCARCKVPWHADVTCDVFQSLGADERGRDDILLMEMAKSKEWQRCPTCKFYVERTQGCMFIKCRCGSSFCYGCATPMTVEHYCTKCRR